MRAIVCDVCLREYVLGKASYRHKLGVVRWHSCVKHRRYFDGKTESEIAESLAHVEANYRAIDAMAKG